MILTIIFHNHQVKKSQLGWSWKTLDAAATLASSSRSREGKSNRTVSSRMQQRLARSRALQSNSRAQAKDSRTQEAATGSSSRVQGNNSIKTLLIKGTPVGSREQNKLQLVVGPTWPTNSSRGRNLKSQRSREIEVRK